eukprot:470995_1
MAHQSLFEAMCNLQSCNIYNIPLHCITQFISNSIADQPQHNTELQCRLAFKSIINEMVNKLNAEELLKLCSTFKVSDKKSFLNHVNDESGLSFRKWQSMMRPITTLYNTCETCASFYIDECAKCNVYELCSNIPFQFELTIEKGSNANQRNIYLGTEEIKTLCSKNNKFDLMIMQLTSYHQNYYMLKATNICGGTVILNANKYDIHKNILRHATNILASELLSNGTSMLNKYSNTFVLKQLQNILPLFSNETTVEKELDELATFIQQHELNELIDEEKHSLYQMDITEIQSTVSSNGNLKIDRLIIINNCEAIEIYLKRGEWPPQTEDPIGELNDHIISNQQTPIFAVQFREHYFLNDLCILQPQTNNNKPIVKLINIDSQNPHPDKWITGRPFNTLVNVVINFNQQRRDILICLRILEEFRHSVMRVAKNDAKGKCYRAGLFDALINTNKLPFDFTNSEMQKEKLILESWIMDELGESLPLQSHKNKPHTFYANNLSIYLNTLQSRTGQCLNDAITRNVLESSQLRCNQWFKDAKQWLQPSLWSTHAVQTTHIFHICIEIMEDKQDTEIEREYELKRCILGLNIVTKNLYPDLFKQMEQSTIVKLDCIECEDCVTSLRSFG